MTEEEQLNATEHDRARRDDRIARKHAESETLTALRRVLDATTAYQTESASLAHKISNYDHLPRVAASDADDDLDAMTEAETRRSESLSESIAAIEKREREFADALHGFLSKVADAPALSTATKGDANQLLQLARDARVTGFETPPFHVDASLSPAKQTLALAQHVVRRDVAEVLRARGSNVVAGLRAWCDAVIGTQTPNPWARR